MGSGGGIGWDSVRNQAGAAGTSHSAEHHQGRTDGQSALAEENFWLGEGLPLGEVNAGAWGRFHSQSSLSGAHVCANDLEGAEERITQREPSPAALTYTNWRRGVSCRE